MASGHSSSSSPSQHDRSDVVLLDRGILPEVVEWKNPPPLLESSTRFMTAVADAAGRQGRIAMPDKHLVALKNAMKTDYGKETKLDEALFAALKDCLADYTLGGSTTDSNRIILGAADGYAVGFVRQKRVANNLCRPKAEERVLGVGGSDRSTIAGMKSGSIIDHAVCLFVWDNNRLVLLDCFGVVELKMSNTSCGELEVNAEGNVTNRGLQLDTTHAALGEAIAYTIGSVYLSYARRGRLKGRKYLPIAMVAGRKRESEEPDNLRWVSGQVRFPEVGGGRFHFSVASFGHFHEKGTTEEKQSVEDALSLYLDTMCDGLVVAIQVWDEFITGTMTSPDPPSGIHLKLGEQHLDLKYCASPISGANDIESIERNSWNVSQGDLFQGKLNISEIRKVALPKVVFAPRSLGETDVIVKVSSNAVHSLLIPPAKTMNALLTIRSAGFELPEELQDDLDALFHELGTVLYAVFQTEVGLISVTADLRKTKYKPLKPIEHTNDIAFLWDGFQDLVRNVLLPMSVIAQVVHPDIRPGYEETSNILWAVNTAANKAVMKLIDYESLVLYSDWFHLKLDDRFVETNDIPDATTFVWWQCVTVAFVWKMQLLQSELCRNDEGRGRRLRELRQVVIQGKITPLPWLMCLRMQYQEGTDKDGVIGTLDFLSKWFDSTGDEYFQSLLDGAP